MALQADLLNRNQSGYLLSHAKPPAVPPVLVIGEFQVKKVGRDLLPAGDEQEEFGVPGALVACAETPVFCAFLRNKHEFSARPAGQQDGWRKRGECPPAHYCNQEGSTGGP
jgi:hypothetical protein